MSQALMRPAKALLIWLLSSALCVLIALNSRFSADMSFFLPAQPSAALHEAIARSIDMLASPLGMVLKPVFTSDPSGELLTLLDSFGDARQPPSRSGVWASQDGERALLLLQTRADGADTDAQASAIAAVETAFADLRTHSPGTLTLQLSGPGYFAVEARSRIQHEIFTLSLLSAGFIIAVLAFVYRSSRLIVLSMLPVVSGIAAGIAAVGLAYDTVFGITVGFGAALIGEAVDYSTYYFTQAGRLGLNGWRARFWPTVRLGVLTSVCGFVALLFAGFPGLAQLGLYSLAGVGAAALVARYLLPSLAGEVPPLHLSTAVNARIDRSITLLQRARLPVLLLAAVATLWLYSERKQLWQADLSALSTVTAAEAALDTQLRADLNAPDSRYMVIASATSVELALQAAERSARILDSLVADGVIDGYDSPTRLLPSIATQRARLAALPEPEALRAELEIAVAGLPVQAARLEAFVAAVAAARAAGFIERSSFADSSLGLAIDALILPRGGQWSVLLPLHPAAAHDYSIPAQQLSAALAGSEALFLDLKAEFDSLYGDYLDEAILLSSAGGLSILLMLVWSLRTPRRLATVALPLLLAIVFVLAALQLAGQRLHLLHLIGILLIVAVGSNYTLFLDRASSPADPEVRISVGIATLTTAIGFGVLGLSSVPVLSAIGLTVGPGALLSLLLAVMFAAPLHPAAHDPATRDPATRHPEQRG